MTGEIDTPLLCVIAQAVLLRVPWLCAEGLPPDAAEELTRHARALTGGAGIGATDGASRRHGLGLSELLTVPTGPTSATLRAWLDEALGPR